ncbi:putative LPS assembly protein LptD, partial [uncultured Maricaulis sp.]|uniref:LPS-assembly protein LptD n=1 Tax=uncultured Maricaulis sp. TaxID=174710 RepID=UPI0030D93FD3
MASQFSRLAAALMGSGVLVLSPAALAQSPEAEEAPVYLEADSLEDLGNGAGFLARGHVRARQSGRTLYADELEYHPELNRIVARGNVVIHGQGPYPQYADEVELDSEMSAGLALGFATMLENNGQMAAAAAIRRSNGAMQLEDAYYTACELCEAGEQEPTWRLRARQVIQDPDEQMIYYRDAQLEVMGVPVLYSPVFAHPDPSADRHSGLLFPGFSVSSRLGFSYQQPYYWAFSPSQDITLAPRVMTNVNPLLFTEYRKRFWSGEMAFEGSVTHEAEIDSDGERFGDETWRWHVFGGGEWEINPDWRWGFGVQRASDDLHLRRYDFSEIDRDRGAPIEGGNRRLVSQIYAEGRTRNSFGSLIAA